MKEFGRILLCVMVFLLGIFAGTQTNAQTTSRAETREQAKSRIARSALPGAAARKRAAEIERRNNRNRTWYSHEGAKYAKAEREREAAEAAAKEEAERQAQLENAVLAGYGPLGLVLLLGIGGVGVLLKIRNKNTGSFQETSIREYHHSDAYADASPGRILGVTAPDSTKPLRRVLPRAPKAAKPNDAPAEVADRCVRIPKPRQAVAAKLQAPKRSVLPRRPARQASPPVRKLALVEPAAEPVAVAPAKIRPPRQPKRRPHTSKACPQRQAERKQVAVQSEPALEPVKELPVEPNVQFSSVPTAPAGNPHDEDYPNLESLPKDFQLPPGLVLDIDDGQDLMASFPSEMSVH